MLVEAIQAMRRKERERQINQAKKEGMLEVDAWYRRKEVAEREGMEFTEPSPIERARRKRNQGS